MSTYPQAMPAHYGYDVLTEYDEFRKEVVKESVTEAMREIYAKRGEEVRKQFEDGQEDPGDSLSRQVGGNHYKVAAIQPWDVMAAYGLDPWSANVLKYLLRFPYKAGRQDLEKAQHYIEYLITHYDEVNDMYYNK